MAEIAEVLSFILMLIACVGVGYMFDCEQDADD